MGLAGGLVRKVFTKTRSSAAAAGSEKSFGAEKSRWSSVRVYLCGDEFNSLLAEDDSASIRGSEATVTQPSLPTQGHEHGYLTINREEQPDSSTEEKESSIDDKSLCQDGAAAILIQSAFRGFLARRQYKEIRKSNEGDQVDGLEEPIEGSEAISTEVQIGGSLDSLSIRDDGIALQRRVLRKSQTQVYRLKEEWDDSTVSSNISKLRIQNRLEAMTRRERALAYAFSQQLRTCSSKKKSSSPNEPNVGWSWLERWMAARRAESSADDCLSKYQEQTSVERITTRLKKRIDIVFEERESCGSNDVSVNLDDCGPIKSRLKATRSMSRKKASPNYCCSARSNKVSKRESQRAGREERRYKQMQPKNSGEFKDGDASEAASDP